MDLRTLVGADAAVLADRDFRLALLASVSSPLGASVVSPLLNSLTGPFGVSEARVGLLMAAYTAPAIVCIPFVGAVSDRWGRKPVLTTGLALFGLAGLAVALTTDFRVALALRLLRESGTPASVRCSSPRRATSSTGRRRRPPRGSGSPRSASR